MIDVLCCAVEGWDNGDLGTLGAAFVKTAHVTYSGKSLLLSAMCPLPEFSDCSSMRGLVFRRGLVCAEETSALSADSVAPKKNNRCEPSPNNDTILFPGDKAHASSPFSIFKVVASWVNGTRQAAVEPRCAQ